MEKQKPPVGDVIADGITIRYCLRVPTILTSPLGAIAMVGGADTTASALSSLFWYLLSDTQSYKLLQAEIDRIYPPGEDALDVSKHEELKFLNACMYVRISLRCRRTLYMSHIETRRYDSPHLHLLVAPERF